MPPAQLNSQISNTSPLSIIKLKYNTDSPIDLNKISIANPATLQSALSPQSNLNFNPSSSPRFSKTSQNWNAFNNFFKKEIQTHNKQLKKNPRSKLIQNTQKLIKNRHSSFDKYILHSTKRLKIISDNIHSDKSHQDKSIALSQTGPTPYFISLSDQNEQSDERMTESMDERRRKSTQEGKRIFKGITSRKGNRLGGFSLELQKYKSTGYQNEEDFVQHTKINLYQSLIYGEHLKTNNMAMPVTESLGGDYSRIERSRSPPADDGYLRGRGRTRDGERLGLKYYTTSGFPTKRVENNQPQVLTIHIKRPENKFRSSLMAQQDKKMTHQYHPRPIPISNINIFKRPNTTLVNGRNNRKDSQIEPW